MKRILYKYSIWNTFWKVFIYRIIYAYFACEATFLNATYHSSFGFNIIFLVMYTTDYYWTNLVEHL